MRRRIRKTVYGVWCTFRFRKRGQVLRTRPLYAHCREGVDYAILERVSAVRGGLTLVFESRIHKGFPHERFAAQFPTGGWDRASRFQNRKAL